MSARARSRLRSPPRRCAAGCGTTRASGRRGDGVAGRAAGDGRRRRCGPSAASTTACASSSRRTTSRRWSRSRSGWRRAPPTIRRRWRAPRTSSSTWSCAAASGAAPGGGAREIEARQGDRSGPGPASTRPSITPWSPRRSSSSAWTCSADAIANPNFDPAEVERARKQALDEIAAAARRSARCARTRRCSRRRSRATATRAGAGNGGVGRGPDAGRAGGALRRDATARRRMTVVVVGDVDAGRDHRGRSARSGRSRAGARPRRPRSQPGTPAPRGRHERAPGSPAEVVVGFRTGEARRSRTWRRSICWPPCLRAATARACSASSSATASSRTACARSAFARATRGLVAFAVTPAPRRIAEAAERGGGPGAAAPRSSR